MKKIVLAALLFILHSGTLTFADNLSLLDSIKSQNFYGESGETFFYDFKNRTYLVSVGRAVISGNSKKEVLNARKSSKIIAKRGLVKFIHDTRVISTEKLISERRVESINENGKVEISSMSDRTTYIETIAEKGQGALRNIIDIGTWKSSDKKEYFYALAVDL